MKNPTVKISVILPCFNAEKTLAWSVNSVLSQTFSDFELICIDDASNDDTSQILCQLKEEDARIKIVKNEKNIGPGASRNRGINLAKGDYIALIDSDDIYEVDFLEELFLAAEENGADIAQCKIRYIYKDRSYTYGSPSGVISGEHCKYRIDIGSGAPYLNPQACGKIYKRSLFENVSYKDICFEDAEILPSLLKNCEKIVLLDDPLYNYNKRFSSLTSESITDIKKISWYFSSIIISITPYVDKEFLALLEKWGEQMPECTFSNLNNFLKSLERSTSFFNECDLDLIQKEYFPFKNKVLSSIPTSYKNRYEKAFLRFEKKIGFEPTPHSLIYKKILSRVGEYKLKTRALNILEKNIPIIDGMIPKRKNVWIFTSWGNYEQHTIDNPRAVFEEAKNDKKIKKIIILNKSSKLLKKGSTSPDVKFIPLHSIKGLFSLMSAGYIFTGYSLHNIFGYRKILSKNRKIVQLWHGIPIKKIGLQVNKGQEPFWKKELPRYHASIAASQLDMQTMIKSFSPSLPEKIKLTGLPRHDFLSKDENELPQDYQQHLKILRNRVNGRKLVLFAPTWREKNQTPCIFTNKQFAQLDSAMKENNAVLAVRLHRNMMKKNTFSSFISNNIFYVNDFPDVNILLREANLLITDYSSIFLDFIKLERKIILYTVDLNDYMSSRGLNYNCEDFLPEKNFICHFDSLIIELNNHFVNGFKTDSRYNSVKHKFHEFELDSNNARRVIDAVL